MLRLYLQVQRQPGVALRHFPPAPHHDNVAERISGLGFKAKKIQGPSNWNKILGDFLVI